MGYAELDWIGYGKYLQHINARQSHPSTRRLARKHPDRFLFSIPLLVVIPVSLARIRSPPGKLGSHNLAFADAFPYLKVPPVTK